MAMGGDIFSSHPYAQCKTVQPKFFYCDVCDKSMEFKDANNHQRGKKHVEKLAAEKLMKDSSAGAAMDWATASSEPSAKAGHKVNSSIECDHCHKSKWQMTVLSVGHIKKECPEKRSARACHNCGEEGHRKSECPNPIRMICRNCDNEGHRAAECPEPKNMSKVQCRNCDTFGHFSKACPEPIDWSRVECTNCRQKGHSHKKCKQPAADFAVDDAGFGASNFGGTEDWATNDSAYKVSSGREAGDTGNANDQDTAASAGDTASWAGEMSGDTTSMPTTAW